MTTALLPLLALLAGAEPLPDRAPPLPPPNEALPDRALPSREVAPPPPPPGAPFDDEPSPTPSPGDDPALLHPHAPTRFLYGAGLGPSRGSLDGLRLTGSSLHLSLDLVSGSLLAFDAMQFSLAPGWYRTPAGLRLDVWQGSIAFVWALGPLRAGVGGGLSFSSLEKALGGRLANLYPFGRVFAGVEAGPVGLAYPFLELEAAGEPGLWEASIRAGLRFDLTAAPPGT